MQIKILFLASPNNIQRGSFDLEELSARKFSISYKEVFLKNLIQSNQNSGCCELLFKNVWLSRWDKHRVHSLRTVR